MQIHGTREESIRQEIRCSDCGHSYLLLAKTLTSRCPRCSNIEYLPSRIEKEITPPLTPEDLQKTSFSNSPQVEEILFRIQEEWLLWAELVNNFANPHYHSAYLSRATRDRELARASERYRRHRDQMAFTRKDEWQVKVADFQLKRVAQLQILIAERNWEKSIFHFMPKGLWHYEYFQRAVWVLVGMILFFWMLRV